MRKHTKLQVNVFLSHVAKEVFPEIRIIVQNDMGGSQYFLQYTDISSLDSLECFTVSQFPVRIFLFESFTAITSSASETALVRVVFPLQTHAVP